MSDDAQEQVQRMLAEARHTEPVPPDVAERLDGVLADLRADRPVRPTVTDLAAARRRRRARTMLIAAAAIVVVGLGIDQLRTSTGGDEDSAGDSAGAAAESAPDRDTSDLLDFEGDGYAVGSDAPQVRTDDFGDRVLALRRSLAEQRTTSDYDSGGASLAKTRCVERDAGTGSAVPIRYDGNPAILVYRPPRGDTQVVDLYVCGRDGVARTITLPAP